MAGLEVLTFRRGPFWNFSYVLACRATGAAVVIDPAWDAGALLAAARERGLTVESVILTHSHSDHINGLEAIIGETRAAVFCHEREAGALPVAPGVEAISRDTALKVGDTEVLLRHVPGHSPGSLAVLAGGHLFSGDTLLVGSVGRPGPGSVEALWESIQGLRLLDGSLQLHPGHDEGPTPSSTLDVEVARVPALRAATLEEFVRELERASGRNHRGV